MKYMQLMYANESEGPNTPEEQQAAQAAGVALLRDAQAAGVLESTGGLPSGNTTTVRVREGKMLITDGPFAETHEPLGGCFLLDCENLDEVIAWAAKIPAAQYGAIEIRPLWTPK
ncbi:MAG TPA: YciI family protein [Aggregatilineaceae bacterium]|jgi:hypothetical protein|nr:YciI family protein [Aggregatilineaceae bacterium]